MAEPDKNFYDFNAPQHYYNFSDGVHEEPDDSYFDCMENEGPYKLETPVVQDAASRPLRSSSKHNIGTPKTSQLAKGTPKKSQMFAGTPKRNPMTALLPKTSPAPVKAQTLVVKNEEEKENSAQASSTNSSARNTPQSSGSSKAGSSKKRKSNSPGVGIRSSPRLAAIAKALRRTNAARRSTGPGSRRNSSEANNSNLSVVNKQKTQHRPSAPKVLGMNGLNAKDHLELQEIATFKQKMARNKKKGESVNAGMRIPTTVPHEFRFATDSRLRQKNPEPKDTSPAAALKRSTRLGPTKPQEFHFATDSRIKKQEAVEDQESVSFPQFLRTGSNTALDKEPPKGPTIPQPFKLTESRKGTANPEVNKFVSVAELNLKFHTRTPQRFRSSKRNDDSDEIQKNKKSKPSTGVTIPVTPDLSTRTRSRQASYLTREEQEQKEFEEEQKRMFKAHPVNKKVFEAPAQPFHVEKKHSTVPEPFNITKSKKGEAPLGDNFKEMCNKLGCSTSSLASLPWGGVPSKWEKSSTKIQPFSFDDRDKAKQQRKQEMIQKIIEDEKKLAEFHAQPMPIFEDGVHGLPEKKPPTPTRSQPFNLYTDQRGEKKREQIQRALEEEEVLDQERRKFKATSDAVVHRQAFIPEKSKKPLTDISGFSLNTEIRAEARTEFELHQKKREDELAAAKKEMEERQAAEEAAEIARLRRKAVHIANPVRHYRPLEIKPAPCPPTVPISPNFATKTRLRARPSAETMSANSTVNISSATFTAE